MKLFTAAIVTETNTFSPIPTGTAAFELPGIQDGSRAPISSTNELATMVRWRNLALNDNHAIVEGLAAVAEPGGITVRVVYERLRDQLLEDLQQALPVDIVLLYLHGAMVAQGYDDCEGDILAHVRALTGPHTVIGCELDPHSHLTASMLEHATLLIGYDEYPHTDIISRGEDLYRLCCGAAQGRFKPVMAAYDCRMTGMYPTTTPVMREYVKRLKAARNGRVLSTSLIHGFPWGDVPEAGTKALAITDGDARLARDIATQFGNELWALRNAVQLTAQAIDTAIDAAQEAPAPVVLADVADNAGGGAPGDSTHVLRRLIERNVPGVVSGVYYDPVAVDLCFESGEDAIVDLRCGGKMGVASGQPLDLRVRVRKLSEQHWQDSMDDSAPVPFGRSAWVQTGEVHLVLASIRGQVFAPNAFSGLGIDLPQARIIVVKSSHHFYGKFAPMAGAVFHVDSPGALQLDFAAIPYAKRNPNYWPRVANPFAEP
ncbi:MAG TPA: M81 family metallopeptidase [Candidatus Baltobacteraceae bacterium]|jgi:microcystin degradation protein MlrC|nr:M81 family metallopeptidase [Candidatus Baltobacteraceae bacterium]